MVTNPTSDREFQRRAEALVDSVDTPEQLELLLREEYRRIRVVRGVTDVVERWYAYREGRWVNSTEGSQSTQR